jgi:hypothetical protein
MRRLVVATFLTLAACASSSSVVRPPASNNEVVTGVIRRPIARTPQSVQQIVREAYGNARYDPATQRVVAENPLGRIEVTLRRPDGTSADSATTTWFFIRGQRPIVTRVNPIDDRGYVDATKYRTVSNWIAVNKGDPMAAFAWERLLKVRKALEQIGPL